MENKLTDLSSHSLPITSLKNYREMTDRRSRGAGGSCATSPRTGPHSPARPPGSGRCSPSWDHEPRERGQAAEGEAGSDPEAGQSGCTRSGPCSTTRRTGPGRSPYPGESPPTTPPPTVPVEEEPPPIPTTATRLRSRAPRAGRQSGRWVVRSPDRRAADGQAPNDCRSWRARRRCWTWRRSGTGPHPRAAEALRKQSAISQHYARKIQAEPNAIVHPEHPGSGAGRGRRDDGC